MPIQSIPLSPSKKDNTEEEYCDDSDDDSLYGSSASGDEQNQWQGRSRFDEHIQYISLTTFVSCKCTDNIK